ncbi:MAG: alanine racemase [Rickettsiales bacterium]|jgi:alanine racemase|nr:alanine racemase [Rickettsiales bacterium]
MTDANFDLIRTFNPKALAENIAYIRSRTKAELGAVIKAEAYGIGLSRVLPIMKKEGVESFFAQDIIDAMDARRILGPDAEIFVMAGAIKGQYGELAAHGLAPACVSMDQIEGFNKFASDLKRKPKAAIHFDTGMNRTGLALRDALLLASNFRARTANLDIVLYMSHLYDSRRKTLANLAQKRAFDRMLEMLPKRRASLAATGGALAQGRAFHYDLLRVGDALYGMARGMRPVASVAARILQIRDVEKGAAVGYSGTYRAPRNMRVAVLCAGFKDGYPRELSHTNTWRDWIRAKTGVGTGATRSWAHIGGRRCPLVGLVSMNNITVDASLVPDEILARERFAEIMGEKADARDFRTSAGFIPADMLCGLMRPNKNAVDKVLAY